MIANQIEVLRTFANRVVQMGAYGSMQDVEEPDSSKAYQRGARGYSSEFVVHPQEYIRVARSSFGSKYPEMKSGGEIKNSGEIQAVRRSREVEGITRLTDHQMPEAGGLGSVPEE
ncbi:hypothetical protein FRC11_003241 [Ceratobasidium sp. 423]|nr:hypothetical protein FRC11_003241 [Ceratobasidium sp. 423]